MHCHMPPIYHSDWLFSDQLVVLHMVVRISTRKRKVQKLCMQLGKVYTIAICICLWCSYKHTTSQLWCAEGLHLVLFIYLESRKPHFKGNAVPNRFGIQPGYRWDGVDRSNGYEKAWFARVNKSKATAEESYKWSVEDM